MAGRYRAYPEYKDSGKDQFDMIPDGWLAVRLKQIVDQDRQITYGIVQAGPNIENGVPYIRPADMSAEKGVKSYTDLLRTAKNIADDYHRSKVQPGDIVCSIGPSFGKLMIVSEDLNGANLTQGTARVAISSKNSTRFCFWALRSTSSYQQWESSVGGATFRALNLGPLAETQIVIPSTSEQIQIANFLDHETAKIDTLIEKQQQLIALLMEKRQAVISHAVTKGLNPDVPMRNSGVEWLGKVPAHWEILPLKYLTSVPIIDGPHESPQKYDTGVPFVSAEAVSDGYIDFDKIWGYISAPDHEKYSKRFCPQRNDILMVKLGATTGAVAMVTTDTTFNIWVPLAAIRVGKKALPEFVAHALRSDSTKNTIKISWTYGTQQTLGLKTLGNMRIPVPPINEQRLLIEYLKDSLPIFETSIRKCENSLELLQERRAALISAAVTGKIDVRNWQPATTSQNSSEKQ